MLLNQAIRGVMLPLIFLLTPTALFADDADDVLAVVQRLAELEVDLEAQAELVTDDRIQIFEMWRRADQAQNLRVQLAKRAATLRADPDWDVIVTIEAPIVKVFGGDAAVVSFKRMYEVIPGRGNPPPMYQTYISMTLIKIDGEWKIAHMHGSTA
ncbi:MAG: nuclear transport factor 2 family protein [Gammaproteobacteria bacterium]